MKTLSGKLIFSEVISKALIEEMSKPLPLVESFLKEINHAKSEWQKLPLWRRLFTNKRRFLRAEAKKYRDAQPGQLIKIRMPGRYR